MSEHLRWGILGTGSIAKKQTADLLTAGIPVTAVGSRSQASADAFAQKFHIPRAHGSYTSLADDPDVDVVYVATPHPMHAENALLALHGGKHVLVEKPFTLNASEAQKIIDTAQQYGKVALEAMWTRVLPHMIRIRELLASGAIGTPLTLIADHSQHLSADPRHRIQAPELGGGALLDLGIYPISFAWDIFAAPSAVQSHSTATRTGVDARTSVLLSYPSGAHAVLHAQLDARGSLNATVIGSKARIEIEPVWYGASDFQLIGKDNQLIEHYSGRNIAGRGMQFQALALEKVVETGDFLHAPVAPEQSVAIMKTLDTIREQIGLRYPGES